ncbi:hypothetical protein BC938DRAFT_475768 [Jimgerdemannia flammicorona]|uniref:F-box domain-containing protein n=1 Tax=Jimgerdemannia flammicorona TaxID=994334 RepID=A0A433PPA2_9FUNG|nr:hypothetical protein BC938DRAFT_475768 [Jimgerdemannia flammicorona]
MDTTITPSSSQSTIEQKPRRGLRTIVSALKNAVSKRPQDADQHYRFPFRDNGTNHSTPEISANYPIPSASASSPIHPYGRLSAPALLSPSRSTTLVPTLDAAPKISTRFSFRDRGSLAATVARAANAPEPIQSASTPILGNATTYQSPVHEARSLSRFHFRERTPSTPAVHPLESSSSPIKRGLQPASPIPLTNGRHSPRFSFRDRDKTPSAPAKPKKIARKDLSPLLSTSTPVGLPSSRARPTSDPKPPSRFTFRSSDRGKKSIPSFPPPSKPAPANSKHTPIKTSSEKPAPSSPRFSFRDRQKSSPLSVTSARAAIASRSPPPRNARSPRAVTRSSPPPFETAPERCVFFELPPEIEAEVFSWLRARELVALMCAGRVMRETIVSYIEGWVRKNIRGGRWLVSIQTHVEGWATGTSRYDALSFSIDRTTLQTTFPLFIVSQLQPFMLLVHPRPACPMHVTLKLSRLLPARSRTSLPAYLEFTLATCELLFSDVVVRRGSRPMRWSGESSPVGGRARVAFQGEYYTKYDEEDPKRGSKLRLCYLPIDRTRFVVAEGGAIGYETLGSDPKLVQAVQYLLCGVQFSEIRVGLGRLLRELDKLR